MKKLSEKELKDLLHYEKYGDSMEALSILEEHDKKLFDKVWYGVGKKEFGVSKKELDDEEVYFEEWFNDFFSSVKWELYGTYGISDLVERECF